MSQLLKLYSYLRQKYSTQNISFGSGQYDFSEATEKNCVKLRYTALDCKKIQLCKIARPSIFTFKNNKFACHFHFWRRKFYDVAEFYIYHITGSLKSPIRVKSRCHFGYVWAVFQQVLTLSSNAIRTPVQLQYCKQVAQLSQRDRAAGWVSNGQKWKTGTERQYLRTI